MAKEKSTSRKAPAPKPSPKTVSSPATLSSAAASPLTTWGLALLAVLITAITFWGVNKLEWTNWDDDEYVLENTMVQSGDYNAIFKTPFNNNYNPLPVAMHAWEWSQVQDAPWLYHFNNLWMHLLCTGLVFGLMRKLGLQPLWAFLAALLFGIHPMRVESVAWVTERKDVMFGMFYIGALLTYLQSQENRRWLWLGVTAVLFTLALFSKIQAVSLPLSMIAIDWYRQRKWNLDMILEKVPFLAGAAAMGAYGVSILAENESLDVVTSFSLSEKMLLGLNSFALYVVKAFVPYETCTYYPYPSEIDGILILGGILGMLIVAAGVLLWKRSREFTFGLAFFGVNIVFLLQVVGSGSAYFADRFTYIGYIGLFFALAMLGQRLAAGKSGLMPAIAGGIGVLVLASIFLTVKYVPVWKDSDTLWTDVIKKYPDKVVLPYVNRGQFLRRKGKNDQAFSDFNKAISLRPDYHLSYLNRGNIYFDRGQNEEALKDYTKVLELMYPKDTVNGRIDEAVPSAFSNRGAIYARKQMYREAFEDFRRAIKYNAQDPNTWTNRAVTYFDLGNAAATTGDQATAASYYALSAADYTEYLKLVPGDARITDARGVSYLRQNKSKEALADFNAAIAKDAKNGNYVMNRAYAHWQLQDFAAAKADVAKAQSLGIKADPAFVAELGQ